MPEAAFISCSSSDPLNTVVCVEKKRLLTRYCSLNYTVLPLFLSGLGATPGGSWCQMMKYIPVIGTLPPVRSGAWLYHRDSARNNRIGQPQCPCSGLKPSTKKDNISINLSLKIMFLLNTPTC